MNINKRLLVKCALATAMVPLQAQATTAQTALEACADALADELSISSGAAVSYQLDPANEGFDRKLRSPERISLYARDPISSELVSQMDCFISSRGRVIRLTDIPLDTVENGNRVSKAD